MKKFPTQEVRVNAILDFWFVEHAKKHYVKDKSFDALIRKEFFETMEQARKGELNDWISEKNSCLAALVVLDQFPRNVFRNSKEAFSQDELARRFAKVGIAKGFDLQFEGSKRSLFYMPLMHSEHLDDQYMCEACFECLTLSEENAVNSWDYATKHRVIIERFSRFPHRNDILGRESTQEEIEFLSKPGSSF